MPRPRTQKNPRPRTALPRTDPLEAKDKGHNAQVFSKKRTKKKVFAQKHHKFSAKFQVFPNRKKKIFAQKIQIFYEISDQAKKGHDLGPFLTNQKVMLFATEDKAFSRTCRLRGQGQGLDLRGQGEGLQNVSSRPKASSRTTHLLEINKRPSLRPIGIFACVI